MRLLLTALLAALCLYSETIPVFHPPDDWEFALPSCHSSYVKVGFLGQGSTPFRPSINLAIEEIDVPARQYLKAVKQIHLAEPSTSWRDLGPFTTQAGEGRLAEITTVGAAGEVKMLQMILVKKEKAYILTGAAIKKDYLSMQSVFTAAFRSLSLTEDLLSLLSDSAAQEIKKLLCCNDSEKPPSEEQTKRWELLQKAAEKQSPALGKYWQLLLLKQGHEKIYR